MSKQEKKQEQEKPSEPSSPTFSEGLMQRVFDANVGKNAPPQGETVPRRELTFVVDHKLCAPNTFPEDFKLTLHSLLHSEEMDATRGKATDALSVGMLYAQRSLCSVNGKKLDGFERDWLWEVLGGGGRQIVVGIYSQLGMATEEALGKARMTLESS